jgi:mRNA interferase RelE/StbE
MYKVIWEADAKKGLKKIDFTIARRIKAKVETYLVQDPIKLGKPLKHEWQGHYRYRCFDNYRVIYQVKNEEILIIVVRVDHRKEIY